MIALLSQPLLLAAGIVAMRQMRRLPETCCSTYQNLVLFVLSGLIMAWQEPQSFGFVLELTWTSWALVIVSSALTLSTQIYKF
jgi:hypothetical protein